MDFAASKAPRRVMGLRDLLLFYVVTGISLRWIATAATLGPSAIAIWLFAWLAFYVPLVLTVMELSSRYPEEGGLYIWSKRAFGEFSGFTTGWTYWTSNLPYFPAILYFAAGSALYIQPARWLHLSGNKEYFLIFSLAGLALATFLNVVGLQVGKWLYNLGALGTWLPVGMLYAIGVAAWMKFGSATAFTLHSMRPSIHLRDVLFWSTIVFALSGSESASFLGDEIKAPRRNIPRALLLAGVVVTTAYILGTMCVLVALPQGEVSGLEGIMQAITQSAGRVGWFRIGPLAAILLTVSNIGTVGAWLAVSARIPFVAGMDRYIPAVFGRLHPRWGTPYVAILMQAGLSVLFIFLSQAGTSVGGAYDVMVSMCIISTFVPYLFTFASLIWLQRVPAGPEVRRIPGGKPVATALGALGFTTTSLGIIASVFPAADEPHKIIAVIKILGLTVALLAAGQVLFVIGKRAASTERLR
jgi:glutamate:GABA antiporter